MFWCYCESLSPKIIMLKKPGERKNLKMHLLLNLWEETIR